LQAASRYLTHVVVLVSAILVPMVSLAGLRPGGSSSPVVTSFAADRMESATRGFIIKPAVATVTVPRREIQTYSIQQGDTLWALSDKFNVSIDSLRWANGITNIDTLALDQKLLIPPVDGVLATVKAGDTIKSLAAKYGVDVNSIIEFNLIRDPDHLTAGTQLMIPGGVGAPLPAAPAAPAPPRTAARSAGSTVLSVTRYYGGGGNHFPYGWCTWYVASRRYVPWSGDAHAWYGNAQAYGFPTGHTPRVGAIMVTWESWWGHVAYVEAVDGACWTVSEMNYRGWGIVDYRHICPGQVPLIGFVY
jgi:surface antigen